MRCLSFLEVVRTNGETRAMKNEDMALAEANEQSYHESFNSENYKSENKVIVAIEEVGIPERIAPEPPPRPRMELIPRSPLPAAVAPVISTPSSASNVINNPSNASAATAVATDRSAPVLVLTSGQAGENKGSGGGYRAMVARTMSRAKAAVPAPSPRTLRKRNALLAKGRKVSVKDFGDVEHQGWLQYRVRGGVGLGGKLAVDGTLGGSTAQWMRAWFLLVGSSFYGFKDRESNKADRLIGLAGFTVALAPEVKSRKFAFKVYHAGKVFYFAAETEESLNEWISCIADATIRQETTSSQGNASSDDGNEAIYFSETDDETNGASCLTPQTNRKNISSGSSNPNLSSSGVLESKSQEVQKKFSSLKKLGSKKAPAADPVGQEPVGSSLDRKYLRFLKSNASRNVPVPTAKFRSYRRAGRGVSSGVATPSRDEDRESSPPPSVFGMVWTPDAAPSHRHTRSESSLGPAPRGDADDIADLRRRRRYVPSPQVAAHAQAVAKPTVAARKGANAPPDVIKRPCRHGSSDDPEERVRSLVGARLASQRRVSIGSPPGSSSTDSSLSGTSVRGNGKATRPGTFPQPLLPSYPSVHSPSSPVSPTSPAPPQTPRRKEFRGGSPEKFWIDSLRGRDEKVVKDKKVTNQSPASSLKLKNAALYRPPPPPLQPKPPKREESHRMKLAFEMNLDQSHLRSDDSEPSTPTGTRSRFRLFSPKLSRKGGEAERFTPSPLASPPTTPLTPPPQKTLLGSPRLHRAIFGVPKHAVASGGDGVFSFGMNLDSPREAVPPPLVWPPSPAPPVPTAAVTNLLEDPSRSQSKPTMGVSMIGKQRRLPPPPPVSPSPSTCQPPSPSPCSSSTAYTTDPVIPPVDPIPDYPGLEYPPVFEPGTYSLSEASFLRANRRLSGAPNRSSPSHLSQNAQGSVVNNNSDKWANPNSSLPLPKRNVFQ